MRARSGRRLHARLLVACLAAILPHTPIHGEPTGAFAGPSRGLAAVVFPGASSEELGELSSGRPVIRMGGRPNSPALFDAPGPARTLRERFKKLAPNYFGEFLFARRYESGYLDALEKLLDDPRNFVGLPYWSKRQGTTYALFDRMDILSRNVGADGASRVRTLQHMEPFVDYRAVYTSIRRPKELEFQFTNEDALVYSYRDFKAAGPGDMDWSLYAFERDGWLWFYGAGGVRAFDLFGLFRDRLEASFAGRVEAFFSFAIKKLGG